MVVVINSENATDDAIGGIVDEEAAEVRFHYGALIIRLAESGHARKGSGLQ